MTDDIDWGDGPRRPQRQLLERDIQKQCVAWFRRIFPDGYARKFRSPANPSVPDYIFTIGRTFYVEFKKPGGKLTKGQEDEHAKIRKAGGEVHVIDNVDDFAAII